MTSTEVIRSLTDRFPLPPETELLEPFVESVDVHGVTIHTVGFGALFRGECITGSAGSLASSPVVRAYMELLERLAVASMGPADASSTARVDAGASSWRASRSNGVAIGTSLADAARRATLELVERDRVLRSWYGGAAPRAVELGGLMPDELRGVYAFEACLFEVAHGAHTAGVFGFPLGDAPLVHGFAAREQAEGAIVAAADECLQRLGFLWGEAVPSEAPEPQPTPSFHQEHYLYPANHDALRRWLRGEHLSRSVRFLAQGLVEPPAVEELRPAWLSPGLWVARALPRGHVPLGFGVAHPLLATALPISAAVHPVV